MINDKKIFFVFPVIILICIGAMIYFTHTEPKTIELYVHDSGKKEVFSYLAEKFCGEHKNRFRIKVLSARDSKQYLRGRIIKDDIPDIIAIDGNALYTQLAENGYLLNLGKKKFIGEIHQNYINMIYKINGKAGTTIFGIPYAVNASGLIYNKTIFNTYNLTPPKTWSELMDVCAVLKKAGVPAFGMSFAESWTCLPAWNNLVPVLVSDTSFIDNKNAGKTTFLETHREVLEKYAAILEYTQGTEAFSASYSDAVSGFASGKYAMLINGIWSIPLIKKVNPDAEIDTIPFPSCDEAERNTVNSGLDAVLMISKKTKQKRLAEKFIQFLLRPENSQIYTDRYYSFSTVNGAIQKNPAFSGLIEIMQEGRISEFPDHYYPPHFFIAKILSDFVYNHERGIPDETNITATLMRFDSEYDECVEQQ